jgi:hypothetical protein
MSDELVWDCLRSDWFSVGLVSFTTLIITVISLSQNGTKDLKVLEDEDLNTVMKYWSPDVTSISYEIKSVRVVRDAPNSRTDDNTEHPISEEIHSSQTPKERVEHDKETDGSNQEEPTDIVRCDEEQRPSNDGDECCRKGTRSTEKKVSLVPASQKRTSPSKEDTKSSEF